MKKIVIIGGGAAGMACAVMLKRGGAEATLIERGQRLGRKLSASGNGQGNVTNLDMDASHYFSDDRAKVASVLARFSATDAIAFLESMGGIFTADARGRVYPCSRQASAVTDLFRRELSALRVPVLTERFVSDIEKRNGRFFVCAGETLEADAVVLSAGGKAAPNFGTDGNGYALARKFGHSVTPLSPALVQIRTQPSAVRSLKGIRIDGLLRVIRAGREIYAVRGDVLFTESGLSGDAAFRASSYAEKGDTLVLDLLPEIDEVRLRAVVEKSGLLCVVNNAVAREAEKRSQGDREKLIKLLKEFPLTAEGTLGFQYAQVTKGGIPLSETDENLMSRMEKELYLAGEILNVDGECGGYNLHWAFASAHAVSEALL